MSILAWSVLLLSAGASALASPQGGPLVCRLVLAEERLDRDDSELAVQLALSEREAAAKIFGLVESLWKNEAIEEIVYLRAKHDRDAALIDHERAGHVLAREEASLEQLTLACDGGEGARKRAQKAFDSYRLASCEVQAADERRAAVDLSFSEAWLKSVRDLRVNNVAAEQDVIVAERDVEKDSRRLDQARARAERCRAGTAGARSGE